MTCVAWDTRTLAADTLCSTDDGAVLYGKKIWRTPQGLYGGAGADSIIEAVLIWLRRGAKHKHKPVLTADSDFIGLLIENDGTVIVLDWQLMPVRYFKQKFAIGSGGNAALALMHAGYDSKGAVQKIIDDKLDTDTGGSVTTLRLRRRRASPSAK